MGEFRMPALGADMTEGMILEWHVQPGDRVQRGDLVALVQTDKADLDVEIWEDGVIDRIVVGLGERVPIGTVLAFVRVDDGAPAAPRPATPIPVPAAPAAPIAPRAPVAPREPVAPLAPAAVAERGAVPEEHVLSPLVRHLAGERGIDTGSIAGSGPGGQILRVDVERAARRVSPRARRLARERGIDLGTVRGTGPGGAVTGDDVPVERAPTPPSRREGQRRAIAAVMGRAAREIPHYYLERRIDLTPVLHWLEDRNRERPVTERVLPAAALLYASTRAALAVPDLNGHWVDDAFQPSEAVHLGVAVAMRGGGLVAPAIHDAHLKDLDGLMADLRDLVNRTRAGRLSRVEMTEATITVTNLGERGVETMFGVVNPPQVALIGFGAVHEEAWVIDGLLGVRSVVHATVSADHRASDGRRGAELLDALARELARLPQETSHG